MYTAKGGPSGDFALGFKFQPGQLQQGDRFGCEISVDTGTTYAVGACGDSTKAPNAGAVYMCHPGEVAAKYYSLNPAKNAQFGSFLGIVGGNVGVGSLFGPAEVFVYRPFGQPENILIHQALPQGNGSVVDNEGSQWVGNPKNDVIYHFSETQSDPNGKYYFVQKLNGPQNSNFGAWIRNAYKGSYLVGAPNANNGAGAIYVLSLNSCGSQQKPLFTSSTPAPTPASAGCNCTFTGTYCASIDYEISPPDGAVGFGSRFTPSGRGFWGVTGMGVVYHVGISSSSGQLEVLGTITLPNSSLEAHWIGGKQTSSFLYGFVKQYTNDGVTVYSVQSDTLSGESWSVLQTHSVSN